MKKLLLLSIAALMAINMFSQDVIVTLDSKRIDAKVEEVSAEYIKYRKTSNPAGPLFVMNTADIRLIAYENGEVQTFEQRATPSSVTQQGIESQPANTIKSDCIQTYTLNPDAPRTDEKLIVENMTDDTINLNIFGLCRVSGQWQLLAETGNLIPYKQAKKHSTFSKLYFANTYKSTYELTQLRGVDGYFDKIATLSDNGKKYRPLFQHVRSDLVIKIYDANSSKGVREDDRKTTTITLFSEPQQIIQPHIQSGNSLTDTIVSVDSKSHSNVNFVGYIEASPIVGGEISTALTGSPEPVGVVLGGSCETFTAGVKIADFAFIGAGLGVNVAGGKSGYYYGKSLELFAVNIPLYADARFWIPIPSQTFRPTVELALGVCFPLRAQVQMSDNYFANATNTSSKNSSLARITNGIDTIRVGPIPDSYRTTGDYAALFRIGIGGEFNRFVFGIGYELWGNNSDCDHFAFVKLGVRVGRL